MWVVADDGSLVNLDYCQKIELVRDDKSNRPFIILAEGAQTSPLLCTVSEELRDKAMVALTKAIKAYDPESANVKQVGTDDRIEFSFDKTKFVNISDNQKALWQEAYPAINIQDEIKKAAVWLDANPKNKKSNYKRFLVNWFKRAQDLAPKADRASIKKMTASPKTCVVDDCTLRGVTGSTLNTLKCDWHYHSKSMSNPTFRDFGAWWNADGVFRFPQGTTAEEIWQKTGGVL